MEAEWFKLWEKIGGQVTRLPMGLAFPLQLLLRHCFEMGWKLAKENKS
jgi:hypothetical protein